MRKGPLRPRCLGTIRSLRVVASAEFHGRNPSVHSLLVTLGNHPFHTVRTYNWPCPGGHLPIWEMTLGACSREQFPSTGIGFCVTTLFAKTRVWSSTLLWHCSASISKRL
jgi:ADP-ribose pyrophosphatase YjhB (NUDIX family)